MAAPAFLDGIRPAPHSQEGLNTPTISVGGWLSIQNGVSELYGGTGAQRRGGFIVAAILTAVVLSTVAWNSYRNSRQAGEEAPPAAAEGAPEARGGAVAETPPVEPADRPLLAIVIDDFGWGVPGTEDAMSLPPEVTVAVIPGGPRSVDEGRRARAAGHEVLLHLPMEPLDPGGRGLTVVPGTITTAMETGEIEGLVEKYLDELGPVPGLNNHTGSRATADLRVVEAVTEVARERGVFVIDSRTAGDSILEAVARRRGVPAASNAMFLDNNREESYVRSRILAAASLARRKGAAIAIGHVNPVTVKAVREALPDVERMGVSLVAASRAVRALNPPPSGLGDPRLK